MRQFIVARQNYLLAAGVVVALTAWMLTGSGGDSTAGAASPEQILEQAEQPKRVQVEEFVSESMHREIVLNGRTEPRRAVTVRAEVDGRVIVIEAARGARVMSGQIIARLDDRARSARLEEARALVKQRVLEYQAAERLLREKHVSETQLAQAQAALEAARAMRRQIEVDVDNTSIRAPFDGYLEERSIEVGDYLTRGDPVARILDQDPLLITGDVSQTDLHEIIPGALAKARLVTGQEVEGRVTYIARESDPATRTFQVEVEVANPDGRLAAGVTSEITIPTPDRDAHFLSPAHLALSDQGAIGVKALAEGDTVRFYEVAIVRATANGLWVAGLPAVISIVTVGQGFVTEGERVVPVLADQLSQAPSRRRERP